MISIFYVFLNVFLFEITFIFSGPKKPKINKPNNELVEQTKIYMDIPSSVQIKLQNLQVLNKLLAHFHEFEQSEKALYALLFPEYYTSPPTFRPTIHTDFIKIERGCMSSTGTLIEQWFPLIAKQRPEFKVIF